MALTELQKLIVGGLNLCHLTTGNIVLIGVMLKTEEQQWAMVDYLESVVENPPPADTVLQKAYDICRDV